MKKITSIAVGLALAVTASTPANSASISWGLDRIGAPANGGAGVRVYVLDSGITADPGFGTRANGDFGDCNGHGTHVAGTIGSSQYGVAKAAQIFSIRTADCSGGVNPAQLISSLDWITKNHPAGTPGVVNMSVAVTKNKLVDAAVERIYKAGLVPVVAAGNFNSDACQLSPAKVANALTVGSINENNYRTNNSNWGSCVDVFAPGQAIVSEDAKNENGSSTKTGTSMAAAHVSGIAAVYLGANPKAKPAEVINAIMNNSERGIVIDAKGSENAVAKVVTSSGVVVSAPVVSVPVAPIAVVSSTPGKVSGVLAKRVAGAYSLSWNPVVEAMTYKIETSADNRSWSVAVDATTNTFANIPRAGYYRVSAVGSLGTGLPSLTVRIK